MNLKHIILSISLGAAIISCKDSFLVDTPPSETIIGANNALLTKADLSTAVNGLYATMNSSACFAASNQTYQELTGDLAFVGVANSGRFTGTNGWGHISADAGAGTGIWNNLYFVIANANFILAYEGKIPEGEGDETVNQLFAHVHAIRAYCYTTLMEYFAPNYGEGDQSLGVPYSTVFDVTQRLKRSSVSEVYQNILSDLNYANQNFTTSPSINKFNPLAVKLLTARVYLYMKNYPKAIEYSQQVLDDSSIGLLTIDKVANFWLLSSENSTSETIFQLYESSSVNPGSNEAISGTWSSSGTYKQNWMTETFYKKFIPASVLATYPYDNSNPSAYPIANRLKWTTNATDVRAKSWYIANAYVNGLTDSPKPINVAKYTAPARDVVLFRKTEAIFIKAEAQYYSSQSDAATTLQSWVKTYRNPSYVLPASSGQGLLDEILSQKGFEFFLEGHRFIDMKRNHKSVDKSTQYGNTFVAPANDYRFIWPIPLTEMQTNPNITQAPGY